LVYITPAKYPISQAVSWVNPDTKGGVEDSITYSGQALHGHVARHVAIEKAKNQD
jgi:hypothetical protein